MASELDIVNLGCARARLEPLSSLTGQSGKTARVVAISYPMMRDALMRKYRWNFTITRVILAPDTGYTLAFGGVQAFALPADCARVIGIWGDGRGVYTNVNYTDGPTWKLEGRHILTWDSVCRLIYQRKNVPVGDWDACFNDVLAWMLARELSISVGQDDSHAKDCEAMQRDALRTARTSNAFETTPEVTVASEWLDARLSGVHGFREGPVI